MAAEPSWVIDEADDRGVPLRAHCECGGLGWVRPDGDDNADTLPGVALFHRAYHNRPA